MHWQAVLPELALAVGAMLLLLLGAFRPAAEPFVHRAAVLLLLACAAWCAFAAGPERTVGNVLTIDSFARYLRTLVYAGAAASLLIARRYLCQNRLARAEFPALLMLSAVGMGVMVSATDLIALYMGIELQSLCLYVLAAFRRDAERSTEAGLKYFVLGALSSGLLLYGAGLVYGFAGSTAFDDIAVAVSGEGLSLGGLFGLAFLVAGIAFKMSAVPFHMWTPDVYEGAPSPVTAFLAAAPKVAAAALLARVLHEPFAAAVADWRQILVFLAVASMFLGAIAAIGQTNIKRLMAYSSIGHMGYALVGLASGSEAGVSSLLFYLTVYLVTNLGVFAFIVCMARDGVTKARIENLAGLSQTQPTAALCIALLMFSLAGIPPLAGFFAKFFVFRAAVEAGLTPLAVAGVVASAVAAFYYLRIVAAMYVSPPEDMPLDANMQWPQRAVMVLGAALVTASWLPFLGGFGLTDLGGTVAASLVAPA